MCLCSCVLNKLSVGPELRACGLTGAERSICNWMSMVPLDQLHLSVICTGVVFLFCVLPVLDIMSSSLLLG